MFTTIFSGNRKAVLERACIIIVVIAVSDWYVVGEIPLGFLYLLPMLLVGSVLEAWQIALVAALCTGLAEAFDDYPWSLRTGIPRDMLYFAAFLGAALFMREVKRSRKIALDHLAEIERQSDARREAEEQLRILIETSPAAILTTDATGHILMANNAAHRMLSVPAGELGGKVIHRFLPSLTNISKQYASQPFFRSVMQARGQRADGESFLAEICFSTYHTNDGMRLAVMVLDGSEELRNHEVSGLHQLSAGSHLLISAVSHEIRNVCAAIAVVYQNLTRSNLLTGNKDFEALGNLVESLARIAGANLQQKTNSATAVDLAAFLDELQIVVSPLLLDDNIVSQWSVEPDLPLVWADRASLMQVFLNLITNSIRALGKQESRTLGITARLAGARVLIEVHDNGGGVLQPEHLFRPFQAGAEATGLGLYLSRAFVRSFGGDLQYQPLDGGANFVVNLLLATSSGQDA